LIAERRLSMKSTGNPIVKIKGKKIKERKE